MSQELEQPDVETSSETYARRFAGPVGEFFLETQTRALLELIRPWPQGSVLDVGGGHAQAALPLAQQGHPVTVVGSQNSCRCRLDNNLKPDAFQFCTGELLSLPFPDRAYDVVIALRLIAHMDDWSGLIAELCRVARYAVILDYPPLGSFNLFKGPLFSLKRYIEHNTRPYRSFRRGQMISTFRSHGFGQPEEIREFFWPMALHRGLHRRGASEWLEKRSQQVRLTQNYGSPAILRVVRERSGQ